MDRIGEAMMHDLAEVGGHLRGHFKLRSGRCGDEFFQFAKLGRRPLRLRHYAWLLGNRLAPYRPRVVVGVAKGAISVGHEVAARLEELRAPGSPHVESVYAEKARFDDEKGVWLADEGSEDLRLLRGYDEVIPGNTVAIIEDAVTTGGSAGRLAAHVRALGGEVVAVGMLLLRGEIRSEHLAGTPCVPVHTVAAQDCAPTECPQRDADGKHLPYTPIPGKR